MRKVQIKSRKFKEFFNVLDNTKKILFYFWVQNKDDTFSKSHFAEIRLTCRCKAKGLVNSCQGEEDLNEEDFVTSWG